MVIAIDGFSSCGKSTLAKQLADALGYTYIDTGAMYRCVALYLHQNNIDYTIEAEVLAVLSDIHIYLHGAKVLLNDADVSHEIRKMYISAVVSPVSKIQAVRDFLIFQQRKIGQSQNVVMDGRDIGTEVFPKAEVKLFVTADTQVRVQRRYSEMIANGDEITVEEVSQNLSGRDYMDTHRNNNPLRQAEDAHLIDNTFMSREEQFEMAMLIIKNQKAKVEKI